MALAREISDAVDRLTTLWSVAAQGARLRLSPHQLRALRILEAAPGLNLTALSENMDIGLPTAKPALRPAGGGGAAGAGAASAEAARGAAESHRVR